MVYSRPSLPVSADTISTQEPVNHWLHLNGIKLPSIEADIGLLIGSDTPQVLQPREVRESKHGGPFATRTIFGRTLNGPLGKNQPKISTANFIDTNADLSKKFEDFCNLKFNDSSYEPKMSVSQNDQRALDIMTKSAKLSDSHYKIGLPWKNDPPCLQNNRPQAESRLQMLKKRPQKDAVLREKYKDFMAVLLHRQYARKVTNEEQLQRDK